MPRIIAIDYGTKRVGLAVTDPLQIIATGLETVETNKLLDFLVAYTQKEIVECFVVGLPKTLSNEGSDITKNVEGFLVALRKKFPTTKIERMDERFSSKIAHQTMLLGGLKKKDRQNKATVDKISATIILQDYLSMNSKI
jgi:putative Holliday junction resolvase